MVVPSPIWPQLFLPQHITLPLVSKAHEWIQPREILDADLMPETFTGMVRSLVVPSPSWP